MIATKTPYDQAVMEANFFGATLKKLREGNGWLQHELAEKAGLTQATIARIEAGKRIPGWETVMALCDALGVSCEIFRRPPKRKRK